MRSFREGFRVLVFRGCLFLGWVQGIFGFLEGICRLIVSRWWEGFGAEGGGIIIFLTNMVARVGCLECN